MADVHNPEIRSYNMSRIRNKNTKPELVVRKYLFSNGFRYRLHLKELPGKPDIVIKKIKTVIFIHGCFWHGHENCKYFVIPQTRKSWWLNKINLNKIKDVENIQKLSLLNWKIIVIWECELKPKLQQNTLSSLVQKLKNDFMVPESLNHL